MRRDDRELRIIHLVRKRQGDGTEDRSRNDSGYCGFFSLYEAMINDRRHN